VTEDKELLRKFENAISMEDALEKIEKFCNPYLRTASQKSICPAI
jgi:hypothetical protein